MSMNLSTKQNNRKIVLENIRHKSEVAIADIALDTGISKPTIQKILKYYEEMNLVVSAGKGESTEEGGKKPVLYQFNKSFGSILTVHIGPSFIFGAIADMDAELLHSVYLERQNDNQENSFRKLLTVLQEFFDHDIAKQSPPLSIVVAVPGIVDSTEGVSVYSPHYTEWEQNYPLKEFIAENLKTDLPIHIGNVNRYQAIAEHWKGKARNIDSFVMIDAMYEGLGAGIFIDDRVRCGYQNFSGEVGHMILQPFDGPSCICGGQGCFEALASFRHVRTLMMERTGLSEMFPDLNSCSDEQLASILFKGFLDGNEDCYEVLDQLARWFAIGFTNIIMVNDPELIILEGIYKDAGKRFLDMIRSHMAQLCLQKVGRNMSLELSSFGAERGVLGAAVYGLEEYFKALFK